MRIKSNQLLGPIIFKWEDFFEEAYLTDNIVNLLTSSKNEKQNSKIEEHEELDLNLSL